jgi:hypothetical protein
MVACLQGCKGYPLDHPFVLNGINVSPLGPGRKNVIPSIFKICLGL